MATERQRGWHGGLTPFTARFSHAMRNELHYRLKCLHRPVQCSRFCLARDQKYLVLLETEEHKRTVKSHFTDEVETRCASRGLYESDLIKQPLNAKDEVNPILDMSEANLSGADLMGTKVSDTLLSYAQLEILFIKPDGTGPHSGCA